MKTIIIIITNKNNKIKYIKTEIVTIIQNNNNNNNMKGKLNIVIGNTYGINSIV